VSLFVEATLVKHINNKKEQNMKLHIKRARNLVIVGLATILCTAPIISPAVAFAEEVSISIANDTDLNTLISQIKNTADYPKMKKIYDTAQCGIAFGSGIFFVCPSDNSEAILDAVKQTYPEAIEAYENSGGYYLTLINFLESFSIFEAWMKICYGIENQGDISDLPGVGNEELDGITSENFIREGLLVLQANTLSGKFSRLLSKASRTDAIWLMNAYNYTDFWNDGEAELKNNSMGLVNGEWVYPWDVLSETTKEAVKGLDVQGMLEVVKNTEVYKTNEMLQKWVVDQEDSLKYACAYLIRPLSHFTDEDLSGKTLHQLKTIAQNLKEFQPAKEMENAIYAARPTDDPDRYTAMSTLFPALVRQSWESERLQQLYDDLATTSQILYPDILDGLYDYKIILSDSGNQPFLPSLPEAGTITNEERSAMVIKIALGSVTGIIIVCGLALITKRFLFSPLKRRK